MSANPTPTRPTWGEIMNPLAESRLWPFIRQAGSLLIEERMHAEGDFDSGISSSDVNHTVFGVASRVLPRGGEDFPRRVLSAMLDEVSL